MTRLQGLSLCSCRSFDWPFGESAKNAGRSLPVSGQAEVRPVHNPPLNHSSFRAQRTIPLGSIQERFLTSRTSFGMTSGDKNVGAPTKSSLVARAFRPEDFCRTDTVAMDTKGLTPAPSCASGASGVSCKVAA